MSTITIEGGYKINGEISPAPNKNSILKLIPSTILCDDPVTIRNVPNTSSVKTLLDIYRQIGGEVSYLAEDIIRLDASSINSFEIEDILAAKERSSFLFLGPLLSRFKKASIKDGGGCKLGNRPLDTMFQGLKSLGVDIDKDNGYKLKVSNKGLNGNFVWLLEASVTGTENLILASVKARGTTVIYNSACEPHTQDLCNFLNSVGAQIEGIGTNKLIIHGVDSLSGGEWSVIPDHIDIGGLIVASLVTKGELRIKNAITEHMTQIMNNFAKFNAKFIIEGNDIIIKSNQELIAQRNFKGDIDKIVDQPWPGFPADLIPQALILALCSEGNMRIYSNMYEVQLIELFAELHKMNAKMTMTNPNQIITLEKTQFKGSKVNASTILQSTHALILAGLVADGITTIQNADIIFRRFPEVVKTYSQLGAKIS